MYINLKGHPMRVCFYTLGCKVNLNETGALEQMFRSAGFTIVPEGEEADVFVVNSCTVTNFGDQKSRKWLRRAKRENPGAVTVLTGCYPQAFPEEAAQFMEADLVCGNGDRKAILDNAGRPRTHRRHRPPREGRAVRGTAGGAVRDPHPRLY